MVIGNTNPNGIFYMFHDEPDYKDWYIIREYKDKLKFYYKNEFKGSLFNCEDIEITPQFMKILIAGFRIGIDIGKYEGYLQKSQEIKTILRL